MIFPPSNYGPRLYSPIDRLAEQLPRPKGTGAEFMADLSKRPGFKPQEAEDRGLHALSQLPKVMREEFLAALKAKRPPKLESDENGDETKYSEYQLPGGKNYHETLITLPEHKGENYTSTHWDEPNVLAHLRMSDRLIPDLEGPHNVKVMEGNKFTNVKHKNREEAERFANVKHQGGYKTEITPLNNKKLLHIEEIQSDWHQAGREHGYKGKDANKNVIEAARIHEDLRDQLSAAKAAGDGDKVMDLMPKVMAADDAVRKATDIKQRGVPDAPFKKDWHELALKHAILDAARRGYHGIVITPGQEQADRYKLSKQVGTVAYHPEEQHFQAFAPNRETIINEKGATPERVSELIGKDVAKRLMSAPQTMGHHTLEGEDLNVGGEGMKGFYDKIIPNFLNKFGKKYGAQVGKVAITSPKETPWNVGDAASFHGMTGAEYLDHPNRSQLEKQFLQERNENRTQLHHFPITEEMRADIKANGLPMYAKGGEVEAKEPKKTVKAYKLFRVHEKHPGKLFPLFVDSNTPVEMNKWIDAKEGETVNGKVKSKIGPLAYRPGWHAGDLPVATHIGEKSDSSLTAPDVRPANHAWAEVEMPNDVDWQTEANSRGVNKQGRLIASRAHITDQLPKGGHYRYKTNSNMTGNWLIGGSMKVNKMLTDKEVKAINKAAGAADLPREQPFKAKKFGFAAGGIVGPEEFKAEEHVNYKASRGSVLKDLEEQVRQQKGEYGAKRVQRAADEIPGLEGMFSPDALRQVFTGDNAKALMTMNPADFEKFAKRMEDTKSDSRRHTSEGDYIAFDDYLKHLANLNSGFSSVPYLEVGKRKPEYLPTIEGHEGRHRSRALTNKGVKSSLVQLLPRAMLREELPRRHPEEFIEALKRELGEKRLVVPQTEHENAMEYVRAGLPSRSGKMYASPEGKPALPDIYAEGGPVPPARINFDALKAPALAQAALLDQYKQATAGMYTHQMPTFAQWLATQGKAEGGSIKPIGYTKEKVTVAPDLNAMKYEMMSVKHFTKKAK